MTDPLKRPLVFGDSEQIDAIKKIERDAEEKARQCKKCEGDGVIEEDCFHCD